MHITVFGFAERHLRFRSTTQHISTIQWTTEAAMTLQYDTQMTLQRGSQRTFATKDLLAVGVYALYCVGYFTGISALIGVIIAHVKLDDETDPMLRSHYEFQIRTFWIGLLYLTIGFILCIVLVGFLVLAWWLVWSMVRLVKGFIALAESKPIANPKSWLFG